MDIKRGDKFLCINTVIMDSGNTAYKSGYIYTSNADGCITDINGDIYHYWSDYSLYFRKVTEDSKIEYVDKNSANSEYTPRECLDKIQDLLDMLYKKLVENKMSYTETHIGEIVELNTHDISTWMDCNNINLSSKEQHPNYTLYYDKDDYPKCIVTRSNRLFVIRNTEIPEEDNIVNIEQVDDGKYRYIFKFYNGGTYFEEVLTEQLDEIKF